MKIMHIGVLSVKPDWYLRSVKSHNWICPAWPACTPPRAAQRRAQRARCRDRPSPAGAAVEPPVAASRQTRWCREAEDLREPEPDSSAGACRRHAPLPSARRGGRLVGRRAGNPVASLRLRTGQLRPRCQPSPADRGLTLSRAPATPARFAGAAGRLKPPRAGASGGSDGVRLRRGGRQEAIPRAPRRRTSGGPAQRPPGSNCRFALNGRVLTFTTGSLQRRLAALLG